MIKLDNTKNSQTFYISKTCCIEPGNITIGSYTKIEADERFQPKGNYISEEKAEDVINKLVDESLTTINSEIEELETSKMEVFQVNQPLSLSREGDDLQMSINLSNYVDKNTYYTKMTELDDEIKAISNQIGNISTALDLINGEVL